MEWVFQPLKPSSLTQRSSSFADHSGSLGASEAKPPKRSGYFFDDCDQQVVGVLGDLLAHLDGELLGAGGGDGQHGVVHAGLVHEAQPVVGQVGQLGSGVGQRQPGVGRKAEALGRVDPWVALVVRAGLPSTVGVVKWFSRSIVFTHTPSVLEGAAVPAAPA